MTRVSSLLPSTPSLLPSPPPPPPSPQLTPHPPSAAQDLDECAAELNIEGGVDDRVEGAVDVAQPGDGTVQGGGNVAGAAVGVQDVGDEEGQPAD